MIKKIPKINELAPDFEAKTTIGDIKFSEFALNSWVILFSHPADFTPVCTTELIGFAERLKEFEELNTKLIGLSIDSLHSHLGWVNNVRKNTGVYLSFPLIADIDMKVAKSYGMLQPKESETATVRAVYIINPERKVKLILYYPLNIGRNMNEIVRVLKNLQNNEESEGTSSELGFREDSKVSTPRIKDIAPDFTVETTKGEITLSEYVKDSWVILFSQPEEPSEICVKELEDFAENKDELDDIDAKLLGLSTCTVDFHKNWIKDFEDEHDVEIDFPFIADQNMAVANQYGISTGTEEFKDDTKVIYFIDPDQVIRLIMYYPMNTSRNIDEVMRVIDALQTSDKYNVAIPLNWQKGDKVVVPPPKNLKEMEKRIADETLEKVDFYLAKKAI